MHTFQHLPFCSSHFLNTELWLRVPHLGSYHKSEGTVLLLVNVNARLWFSWLWQVPDSRRPFVEYVTLHRLWWIKKTQNRLRNTTFFCDTSVGSKSGSISVVGRLHYPAWIAVSVACMFYLDINTVISSIRCLKITAINQSSKETNQREERTFSSYF